MDIGTNIFKGLMEVAFSITGDWGIAIVLLTLVVKLVLMPLSIKQKVSMKKQMKFSKEVEAVKIKYKNKKKQEEELTKLYSKNKGGALGCLIPFMQLPIISGLYMTIGRLPVEAITMIVPWVMNIGSSDNKFIIPLIYAIISILPAALSYLSIFKDDENHTTIKSVIPMVIFGVIITIKAPIGLGIYFITSGLFTLIEDIAFKLYSKNRKFA